LSIAHSEVGCFTFTLVLCFLPVSLMVGLHTPYMFFAFSGASTLTSWSLTIQEQQQSMMTCHNNEPGK